MSQVSARGEPARIPDDLLAPLAGRDTQQQAGRMAQDAFARVFRLTVAGDALARAQGVAEAADALAKWSAAGGDPNAAALRLAMLVIGLDQWGVAYSRAFELQAIPGLSELVGALRTRLDPQEDARFQQQFLAVDAAEGNAIDFKIELRRAIHLAVWHAMVACEEREEAAAILVRLSGMMVALVRLMPELGWRLVADALAHIQIRCVSENIATDGLAREMNEAFFETLSGELPADTYALIMAHASKAVIAWQQASRASSGRLH